MMGDDLLLKPSSDKNQRLVVINSIYHVICIAQFFSCVANFTITLTNFVAVSLCGSDGMLFVDNKSVADGLGSKSNKVTCQDRSKVTLMNFIFRAFLVGKRIRLSEIVFKVILT